MEPDRNMLTGVLAMQAELIDANEFVEACSVWTNSKEKLLVDILIERGWLLESDKVHLDYLLDRKQRKDGGNARLGLARVSDDIKRSLAGLNDPAIIQSLAGIPHSTDGNCIADTGAFAPQRDDRYELKRLHATGGIGRVWLAHDKVMGRDVALKDLRPERSSNDLSVRNRFVQEARITGQLEHPGIVPVYELADRSETREPFYTMRFVKGRTLADAVAAYHRARQKKEEESFDLVTLLNAFVTVCKAVAFAHSRGIIHRDLKGQNVVVGDYGEVVLLDWGLAKDLSDVATDYRPAIDRNPEALDDLRLTMEGEAVGTPAYMSPEQATGQIERIDDRTDVYGLGAMLYEILTGQPPFTGSDTNEVIKK